MYSRSPVVEQASLVQSLMLQSPTGGLEARQVTSVPGIIATGSSVKRRHASPKMSSSPTRMARKRGRAASRSKKLLQRSDSRATGRKKDVTGRHQHLQHRVNKFGSRREGVPTARGASGDLLLSDAMKLPDNNPHVIVPLKRVDKQKGTDNDASHAALKTGGNHALASNLAGVNPDNQLKNVQQIAAALSTPANAVADAAIKNAQAIAESTLSDAVVDGAHKGVASALEQTAREAPGNSLEAAAINGAEDGLASAIHDSAIDTALATDVTDMATKMDLLIKNGPPHKPVGTKHFHGISKPIFHGDQASFAPPVHYRKPKVKVPVTKRPVTKIKSAAANKASAPSTPLSAESEILYQGFDKVEIMKTNPPVKPAVVKPVSKPKKPAVEAASIPLNPESEILYQGFDKVEILKSDGDLKQAAVANKMKPSKSLAKANKISAHPDKVMSQANKVFSHSNKAFAQPNNIFQHHNKGSSLHSNKPVGTQHFHGISKPIFHGDQASFAPPVQPKQAATSNPQAVEANKDKLFKWPEPIRNQANQGNVLVNQANQKETLNELRENKIRDRETQDNNNREAQENDMPDEQYHNNMLNTMYGIGLPHRKSFTAPSTQTPLKQQALQPAPLDIHPTDSLAAEQADNVDADTVSAFNSNPAAALVSRGQQQDVFDADAEGKDVEEQAMTDGSGMQQNAISPNVLVPTGAHSPADRSGAASGGSSASVDKQHVVQVS